MRLRFVAKLAVVVSVSLFCIGVGAYYFLNMSFSDSKKNIDLYSYVPSDAIYVIESDNINYYFDKTSEYNKEHITNILSPNGVASFMLNCLQKYTLKKEHGLNGEMSHVVISAHDTLSQNNQIFYFSINSANKEFLNNVFRECLPHYFEPKIEKYDGKDIYVYPISNHDFLSVYSNDGVVVASFQKRLVEKVINDKKNDRTLQKNRGFLDVKSNNKVRNFFTIYTNSFFDGELTGKDPWSKLDLYINNNLIYLLGETNLTLLDENFAPIKSVIKKVPNIFNDSLIISANTDSIKYYIDKMQKKRERDTVSSFNECVADLNQDYPFMMVVDMNKVKSDSQFYKPYILPYVWRNNKNFNDFIYSAQFSFVGDKLKYIIMLTPKA